MSQTTPLNNINNDKPNPGSTYDQIVAVNGIDQNKLNHVTDGLSPTGKKVVEDAQELIQTAKVTVQEKNKGGLVQKIINEGKETNAAVQGSDKVALKQAGEHMQDSLQQVTDTSLSTFKVVVQLLAVSPHFRRLLGDMYSLARESIADLVPVNIEDVRAKQRDVELGEATPMQVSTHLVAQGSKQFVRNVNTFQIPDKQLDDIVERLRAILLELQLHPEYQSAISNLLSLFDTLSDTHKEKLQDVVNEANETTGDSVRNGASYARELIENFAGGRSMQPMLDSFRGFKEALTTDQQAQDAVRSLKYLTSSTLRAPTLLDEPSQRTEFTNSLNVIREKLGEKYSDATGSFFDETKYFLEGFKEDELNQKLAQQTENLVRDLFLDAEGKATIKPELLNDLGKVITHIVSSIKFLPLPRIENSDDKADIVLDDIILSCNDMIPDQVVVRTATKIDLKNNNGVTKAVHITMRDIRGSAKNTVFYYKKKTTPKMTDTGLVDLDFSGESRSIQMDLYLADSDTGRFRVDHVDFDLSKVKIKFHETRHDVLYTIFSPLINSRIKTYIQNVLEALIKEWSDKIGDGIVNTAHMLKPNQTDESKVVVAQ